MMERIENRMVVDFEWDEIEYRVPNKRRLKRMMEEHEKSDETDDIVSVGKY